MTRISGANLTASQAQHVEMRVLVSILLDSGTLNICSGLTNVVNPLSLSEYTAIGGFGAIDSIREDTDLRPNSLRATLSGIDPDLLPAALTEDYQGRDIIVSIAFLSATTLQMVADPYQIFAGPMEQMVLDRGPNEASITLTAQDEFARWSRPRQFLLTDAQQKQLYSGDSGLSQVVYIQNRQLYWGGQNPEAGTVVSAFKR